MCFFGQMLRASFESNITFHVLITMKGSGVLCLVAFEFCGFGIAETKKILSSFMSHFTRDLAAFLASRTWNEQQIDDFEASREVSRNIVNFIGWDNSTQPLIDFWVVLTMVKVIQDGRDASDIGPQGMGSKPFPALGMGHLVNVNCYQKKYMKLEAATAVKLCQMLHANVDALMMSNESERALQLLQDVQDSFEAALTFLEKTS